MNKYSESPAVNPQDISEAIRSCYWKHVDKNGPLPEVKPELGPCWVWKACLTKKGYGRMLIPKDGKRIQILAHRLGYAIQRGPVPENLRVLHACGTRTCQRADHLYLGTDAENGRDTAVHDRRSEKLTNPQVIELRSLYETMPLAELAKRYNIAPHYAYKVATGRSRRHVGEGVKSSTYRQRFQLAATGD